MICFNWLLLPTPIQTKQLLNVFLSAFLPQNRFNIDQLSDYFHKKIVPRLEKGQLISTACDNDRILGFVIFEKWVDENYYLAEMAVLPDYQHKGIGKKLVFSILEKDSAVKKILLVTEKANRWSQSFYEKIGFQRSSFQHPDYAENFLGYEFDCLRDDVRV